MKIRKARKSDVKELAKLAREYDKYENKLNRKHKIDSLKDNEDFIRKILSSRLGIIFVLEIGGKLEGVISGEYGETLMGRRGMIHYFFVSEKERENGYGRKLISSLENYFKKKKCKSVKSFVFLNNKKAFGFYEKLKYNLGEKGVEIRKKLK